MGIETLGELVYLHHKEAKINKDNKEFRMHAENDLVVAVIAMYNKGNCGAASTLGENNNHRGQPDLVFQQLYGYKDVLFMVF